MDNDNGEVVANGFAADLKIRSGNGSVRVGDPRGRLDLESDNGRGEATGVASRHVAATSDNGVVELGLHRGSRPRRRQERQRRGGLAAAGSTYKVEVKADNGDVDISVPRDDRSEHHVTAHSDNGGIAVRTAN